MRIACLVVTLQFLFGSLALAGWYDDHARGWYWYEQQIQKQKEIQAELQPSMPVMSPTEQVKALRKDAELKLHRAMMEPTEQNVIDYIKAQRLLATKSESFAQTWQKVLFYHPELNPTTTNPVSNNALHIHRQQETLKTQAQIKALAKDHGLFFFFRGDCPYCQAMAPLVKNFAEKYGWKVVAIQLGNVGLAEFPEAKKDNGIVASLGVNHVPALMAVKPGKSSGEKGEEKEEGKVLPLAYGYISESEIEDRVKVIAGGKYE